MKSLYLTKRSGTRHPPHHIMTSPSQATTMTILSRKQATVTPKEIKYSGPRESEKRPPDQRRSRAFEQSKCPLVSPSKSNENSGPRLEERWAGWAEGKRKNFSVGHFLQLWERIMREGANEKEGKWGKDLETSKKWLDAEISWSFLFFHNCCCIVLTGNTVMVKVFFAQMRLKKGKK